MTGKRFERAELNCMRLMDCFVPILLYTRYLLRGANAIQTAYSVARADYERLLAQSSECAQRLGFSRDEYDKALFAVCAWVDESILSSSWDDRMEWLGNELQRVYFHTNNAGEQFFTDMEKLSPGEVDVRQVYTMCLALGFKGRYHSEEDEKLLKELISRQIGELTPEEVGACMSEPAHLLFPAAYPSESTQIKRRKRLKRSSTINAILLLSFLISIVAFGAVFFIYDTMLDQTVHTVLTSISRR